MRKFLAVLAGMLFLTQFVFSQTGTIRGKVIDEKTGEAMIGANIIVIGSDPLIGTITDFDGNYTLLNVPAGTSNLQFSMISFETKVIEAIEVKEDDVTILDIALGQATLDIAEVTIKAAAVKNTESALLTIQRKSATVVDGISSQQMKKLGDSDAAGALKRVTGVTVQSGKYVYVRGLSDRYMKVTLNGAEVPGLDPEVNSVQMDMFPGNIIDNMIIHKTFSPDLPTFTGGHVDIITKDFPERFTLQFGASYGFNLMSNFNDNFISYDGGKTDWLAYDDGTRDKPGQAQYQLPSPYKRPVDSLTTIGQAFNKDMQTFKEKSGLDQSYSFSIGNQINFLGKPLGFIATANYKKEFDYLEDIYYGRYLGNDLKVASQKLDLDEDYGKKKASWSLMGGLSYKLSNNHKISFLQMHNQSGSSGARYFFGNEIEEGKYVRWEYLEYLQRSISASQMRGKHVLPQFNNATVEWQSSYILSKQKEPDMRFWYNDYDTIRSYSDGQLVLTPTHYTRINKKPTRSYRNMWEENFDNAIHFTVPLTLGDKKSKLKFGGTYISKYRDSEDELFTLNQQGSLPIPNGSPAEYLSDENFVQVDENGSYKNNFIYYDNSDLTNDFLSYTAKEINLSGYAMIDMNVFEKLRIVFGAKAEKGEVDVVNKVFTDTSLVIIDDSETEAWKLEYPTINTYTQIKNKANSGNYSNTDILPSINASYSLTEKMNLRAAYARSISRPAFREIAPYSYWDSNTSQRKTGNPLLKRGLVDNIDVRYEYYNRPGEIAAISLFYKYLQNPIEEYLIAISGDNAEVNIRNNSENATLYGIEMELRKKMDFIDFLKDVSVGGNLTLIQSFATEDSARMKTIWLKDSTYTNERKMYGQSPYIINAFVSYDNKDLGLTSALGFNMSGPKIVLLGATVTPDVYEFPFPLLDFTVGKKLNKGLSFGFKVKNLLNSELIWKHKRDDFELDYLRYKPGRTYTLSINYKL